MIFAKRQFLEVTLPYSPKEMNPPKVICLLTRAELPLNIINLQYTSRFDEAGTFQVRPVVVLLTSVLLLLLSMGRDETLPHWICKRFLRRKAIFLGIFLTVMKTHEKEKQI